MGKHAGPTGPGASSRCVPTSRGPAPAVRPSRARRWALAGLIGLEIVWGVGLFMGAGTRLRGARNASRASAAARNAVTALRGPVPAREPGPGWPVDSSTPPPPRVEVLPVAPAPDAPPNMAGAAERQQGASKLPEGRPGPEPGLPAAEAADPPAGDVRSLGRELFARTWRPDDPRCHGGDGLGPVYNAASCLHCHSLGGPGGAGPVDQNVELATGIGYTLSPTGPMVILDRMLGGKPGLDLVAADPDPAELVRIHPGFRDATSTVLHRFGVEPNYSRWRATFRSQSRPVPALPTSSFPERSVRGPRSNRSSRPPATVRFPSREKRAVTFGGISYLSDRQCRPFMPVTAGDRAILRACLDEIGAKDVAIGITARNPPPLFGTGLIDGLAATELERVARQQPPSTRGRVHRLEDGRIGRFGWRAQVASLEDFVLSACANELGLEVPGHHQAVSPLARDAHARGLDLTDEECAALVDYVRTLPPPVSVSPDPSSAQAAAAVAAGRRLFRSVGCASCHIPDLGSVRGIYSDLLLHDMGEELSDPGSYDTKDSASRDHLKRGEWRTPPLWGVRDSAPYLHDGRARSLAQAVALHAGQGAASADRFRALRPGQQSQVLAFLNSLAAPGPTPAP
jgi:CxxC motif-containing protein (DUF1111 family)